MESQLRTCVKDSTHLWPAEHVQKIKNIILENWEKYERKWRADWIRIHGTPPPQANIERRKQKFINAQMQRVFPPPTENPYVVNILLE
jgi:hypothetical protein